MAKRAAKSAKTGQIVRGIRNVFADLGYPDAEEAADQAARARAQHHPR